MTSNYYAILLQQLTNALNFDEAKRIAGGVAIALEGSLPEGQAKQIFALLPNDAGYQSKKYYHRVPKHVKQDFNAEILFTRTRIVLNLTDQTEARSYVKSYFQAALPLMSPSDKRKLLNLLPPQLGQFL